MTRRHDVGPLGQVADWLGSYITPWNAALDPLASAWTTTMLEDDRPPPSPRIYAKSGWLKACRSDGPGTTAYSVNAMSDLSSDCRVGWCCPDQADDLPPGKFSELLRKMRLKAGLSQQQLATRLGTTQSAVARLESGTTQPRLETVEKLAETLGQDLLLTVRGRAAS